ncbi:ATP-binding protein [Oligoflexaceae bacterium]|nr:ATP-binding protein [Oligoflexaceae bacterium]
MSRQKIVEFAPRLYRKIFNQLVSVQVLKTQNRIEIFRWHIIVCAHMVALAVLPLSFAVEAFEFGFVSFMTAVNTILYLSIAGSLWLLKKTGKLQSSASLIIAAAVCGTIATSFYNDGIFDPSISWLVLVPVLAALFGNVKTVLMTTLLAITSLAILWLSHMDGLVISSSNTSDVTFNHFVQLCIPIIFSAIVSSAQDVVTKIATAETKRIQKELVTEQQSFFHSQRLKSLGEMGAGIAHEINNPLAVISGTSQLTLRRLEKKSLTDELLETNLNKIIDTTNRISAIIKSMKRISGYKHFDENQNSIQITNLHEEISAAVSIQSFNLKGIDTKIKTDADLKEIQVIGQDGEISQVLSEMISNSANAIGTSEEPWISIKVVKLNTTVKIQLIDSGDGIDKSIHDKIFQPFYTTRQHQGGTGLGMGVAKAMVESHGGSIKYLANQQNTTFEITLLIAREVNEAC